MDELAEILSERFLVAFVLVVRCEMCLTFTYRSPRMLVGCGDEEFPLFSAESEPVVLNLLFKLPVKNGVWQEVGEKLDRNGKLRGATQTFREFARNNMNTYFKS